MSDDPQQAPKRFADEDTSSKDDAGVDESPRPPRDTDPEKDGDTEGWPDKQQ